MDFIAIDVETANPDFSSICQIGVVRYDNGTLAEEWNTYIDPEDFFSPVNISIHGIDEYLVKGAPKFYQIFDKLKNALDERIVVTHTSFDRVSLNQACNKYNLSTPNPIWVDSAKVARMAWEQFSSSGYGLANICAEFNYKYKAHDALEDAKAAAFILLKAINDSELDLNGWVERVKKPITSNYAKTIKIDGNPDGPLFGTNIVFTGALNIPRKEAADLAAKLGCNVQAGVNKNTDILVVGDQDIKRLGGHEKSSKQRKSEDLISKGQIIRIICEKDYKELISTSE